MSIAVWNFQKSSSTDSDSKKIKFLEYWTISIASIFGISFYDANEPGTNTTARLALFLIFLFNSLFFYTYCGFLTSSLAVPIQKLPFQSPEDILKTNFR